MRFLPGLAIGCLFMSAGTSFSVAAEGIAQALAAAYATNPEINVARAQTRADDENVPIARSGYRPIVSLFSTVSGEAVDPATTGDGTTLDANVGLQATQNLFTGFRVRNSIMRAESGVLASRELLNNTEQNVLFDTAQAFQDVLRGLAVLEIRRSNVLFLNEQVRGASERMDLGEGTRTDISQARARVAGGRAAISAAEAALAISRATFRQLVGHEPQNLTPGFPFSRFLPSTLGEAVAIGQDKHPIILATIHQADAQGFVVKQIEGELLPTVSLEGRFEHQESLDAGDPNTVSIIGRVTIPIYQGGAVSGRVRQAKEIYGLRRVEIDLARDLVRAAVVAAWAQAAAAEDAIAAAREGITAAEDALTGVQEEQRVGNRTTLDVLDAQSELLSAQETLAIAERDRAVARFALLSATGRLSPEDLDLPVAVYRPSEHYDAVRDKWYGITTPDGR